jgi:hypothetical protein
MERESDGWVLWQVRVGKLLVVQLPGPGHEAATEQARHVQSACSLTPRYLNASVAGSGVPPQCRAWLVSEANCGANTTTALLAGPILAAMRHLLHQLWQVSTVVCRASRVLATPVKSSANIRALGAAGQAGACAATCWRLICSATVWAGGWAAAAALLIGRRRGGIAYGQGHALAGRINLAQQIVNVDIKQQARQGVAMCCARSMSNHSDV